MRGRNLNRPTEYVPQRQPHTSLPVDGLIPITVAWNDSAQRVAKRPVPAQRSRILENFRRPGLRSSPRKGATGLVPGRRGVIVDDPREKRPAAGMAFSTAQRVAAQTRAVLTILSTRPRTRRATLGCSGLFAATRLRTGSGNVRDQHRQRAGLPLIRRGDDRGAICEPRQQSLR